MILFYLFLRPRPFRERSLAHAFTFFFFLQKKTKKRTNSLPPNEEPLSNTLSTQDPGLVSAYGPLAVTAVAPAAIVPSPVRF